MPLAISTLKRCTRCKQAKPLSEFWRHKKALDGLQSSCRTCALEARKDWRTRNPGKWRAQQQRYRKAHPEAQQAARERTKEWYERNPQAKKAHNAVGNALRTGRLVRPETCSRCSNGSPQAHHPDYSLPLQIVWLCQECHLAAHGKRGLST